MNIDTMRALTLVDEIEKLGARIPANIQTAMQAYRTRKDSFDALVSKASSESFIPLVESLMAGTVTAKEALPVLIADVLTRRQSDANEIAGQLDMDVLEAMRAHAGEVVEALRPAFDEAATTMTTARATLGDIKLDDLQTVAQMGGNAAQVWKDATEAQTVITTIMAILTRLSAMGGYAEAGPRMHQVLRMCDVSLHDYQMLPNTDAATPWDVVRNGHALDLASSDEWVRRCTQMDEAWRATNSYRSTRRFDANAVTGRYQSLSA